MRRDKIHSSVKLATTQPTQFYLADFMHVKLSVRGMTHFFISVLSSPILKKRSACRQSALPCIGNTTAGKLKYYSNAASKLDT